MVKRKAQNAIAVVSIDIGKNRSRYWITMSKRQPEKTSIARRKLLAGGVVLAGSAASAALSTASAGAADNNLPPRVPAWMKEQGAPFLSPPYGQPSPFEKNVIRRPRAPTPTNTAASSMTPWQNLHGIITPNGLHFERHHAGVPAIDPDQHRLVLHGLVKRPLIFTMDDIVRFPSESHIRQSSILGASRRRSGDTGVQHLSKTA
jgi:sulfane dehydrogenase subunit SoxC